MTIKSDKMSVTESVHVAKQLIVSATSHPPLLNVSILTAASSCSERKPSSLKVNDDLDRTIHLLQTETTVMMNMSCSLLASKPLQSS